MTPALADANNGNWQTAQRWAGMLGAAYRVRLASSWTEGDDDLLIALHARRSAPSMAAWERAPRQAGTASEAPPTRGPVDRGAVSDDRHWPARRPSILVLTGTDLYRDIADDASSQRSIDSADRLVVLNEVGARQLPAPLRPKSTVVLQSCTGRPTLTKPTSHLRALMVGHLREEKSPTTYFDAARLLADRADIRLDHIGSALDPDLGAQAIALTNDAPHSHYHWLGALSHEATRRRIQRAHVLVHPSRMEGGAHVVTEAVRSGTPVAASRIDGNVGLLGEHYDGYFPVGDAAALATLLRRLREEPAMLKRLCEQCDARAPLFDPAREQAALQALVADLLDPIDRHEH
ncbi:MAG: glycosyl transferase group 1 [Rhizobacter sp.]|nr:glycosyl transferase group 1 [Rhizobacter sp.]